MTPKQAEVMEGRISAEPKRGDILRRSFSRKALYYVVRRTWNTPDGYLAVEMLRLRGCDGVGLGNGKLTVFNKRTQVLSGYHIASIRGVPPHLRHWMEI